MQQFFFNGGSQALIVRVEGDGGGGITDADIIAGLPMLDQADLFNLLCIPPLKRRGGDVGKPTWDAAIAYAKSRRAFVIVDPAEHWATADDVLDAAPESSVVTAADNAAIYFPRILVSDPLNDGSAGQFRARRDHRRHLRRDRYAARRLEGAGRNRSAMQGVSGLSLGGGATGTLTDADSGRLNPAGINCLRSFPTYGNVVWGARTLKGADALASDWKYIPVRRLAYYIEESVLRGTSGPCSNRTPSRYGRSSGSTSSAFMQTLFMQGAFQGTTPAQAYFVQCDSTTTTQADIENGIVNIVIGFAPVNPAEFVIIRIQQMLAPAS